MKEKNSTLLRRSSRLNTSSFSDSQNEAFGNDNKTNNKKKSAASLNQKSYLNENEAESFEEDDVESDADEGKLDEEDDEVEEDEQGGRKYNLRRVRIRPETLNIKKLGGPFSNIN